VEYDWHVRTENAIAWARGHLGSTAYTSRCLAFVEDAYERPNRVEISGGDYAGESAELYRVKDNTGEPPVGSFVFYDCRGEMLGRRQNRGHVGLCVGDGLVIHAWDRVRIDPYPVMENLAGPPAWDAPSHVGWAPVERVFQGCRPKDWTAEGDAVTAARRMQAARLGGGAAST
jgi:hypothetical protein